MSDSVPQFLRDHARTLEKRSLYIADWTMRYGSDEGLTLLSLRATDGRCGYDELLAEAREIVASGSREGRPSIDVVTLALVAQVMAGRPGPEGDFVEAADLMRALRILRTGSGLRPGRGLPRDIDCLEAQTNIAAGHLDHVERILPELVLTDEARWMLDSELLHPDHTAGGGNEAAWLSRFNSIFERWGLTPIALEPGGGKAFDRVVPAATSATSTDPGPVVSVVMSVFKPGQTLVTALRSLSAQTWPHLQVLVVDDCSPAEYHPMIERAVALDDRFELHRMPMNGGTYKIRNYAIAVARGDFITFQDSDDWSHPERIERQLQPLLKDPSLVASMSRSIRAFENLSVSKIGYAPLRVNASSLLMRRDPVINELGGFDEVRKSADSEFVERLEKHFGRDRMTVLDEPSALVQLTRGSLSRDDFVFGWSSGSRFAYRHSFEHFHDKIARGTESVRLEPGAPRRFPAPRSFIQPPSDQPGRRDVVVMSDWRADQLRYAGADDEVGALVEAGFDVGLLHAEAPRYAARPRLSPSSDTMELVQDGRASFDSWEEPLEARIAYVRDPELLCYPCRPKGRAVRADSVIVYAGHPPRAPEDGAYVYDPVAAEVAARSLLGVDLAWQPATTAIAEALVADGAAAEVLPPALLGVAQVSRRAYAGMRGTSRPIIGTTGLEGWATRDRPTVTELVELLPDDDDFDVRIRDSAGTIDSKARARGLPPNWIVSTGPTLERFVDQLDVYMGWRRQTWGPEHLHSATVAIARGCVAVLDPAYEGHFRDAAIYTKGQAAGRIAQQLHDSPGLFEAQQERGYSWAAGVLSQDAFVRLITARLDQSSTSRKRNGA
jgi:glycosyltransferase involved in cell wall biosynthesis